MEAVAKAGDVNEEYQSTEQMLHQIENACEEILKEEDGEDIMTMSLNAKKLYQSLEVNPTAKEIAQEILE